MIPRERPDRVKNIGRGIRTAPLLILIHLFPSIPLPRLLSLSLLSLSLSLSLSLTKRHRPRTARGKRRYSPQLRGGRAASGHVPPTRMVRCRKAARSSATPALRLPSSRATAPCGGGRASRAGSPPSRVLGGRATARPCSGVGRRPSSTPMLVMWPQVGHARGAVV
jgi:hypothetical protein